jgi:hypothetical protein
MADLFVVTNGYLLSYPFPEILQENDGAAAPAGRSGVRWVIAEFTGMRLPISHRRSPQCTEIMVMVFLCDLGVLRWLKLGQARMLILTEIARAR